MANAGLRAAREGGRNEKGLVEALARSQNISLLTQQMNAEQLKALAARAIKEGDPFSGEKVYRRQALACTYATPSAARAARWGLTSPHRR